MTAERDHGVTVRPGELFACYMRGWHAGAGMRAMDPKFAEHKTRPDLKAEYERGYGDGRAAGGAASAEASARLGYTPTVLRLADSG
jgi:hypothetical protein